MYETMSVFEFGKLMNELAAEGGHTYGKAHVALEPCYVRFWVTEAREAASRGRWAVVHVDGQTILVVVR